jgi:hypothetical protein
LVDKKTYRTFVSELKTTLKTKKMRTITNITIEAIGGYEAGYNIPSVRRVMA